MKKVQNANLQLLARILYPPPEELLARGAGTAPPHASYFGWVRPLDDALGVACWMCRPKMARFLLERKADANALYTKPGRAERIFIG